MLRASSVGSVLLVLLHGYIMDIDHWWNFTERANTTTMFLSVIIQLRRDVR